ncbi:hypothetical protein QEM02_005408 [Pseudomonas putida]|nr:hypothetical protein [Pseudomonas putida]
MFVQTDGTGKVLVDFADGVNEWGKALELDEAQYEALRQEAFQIELADLQDIPTYTELYPPADHGGAITSPNGNTLGRVIGETPPMGKTADGSNADVDSETPAEGVTGEQVLDGIQLGLDIVGLIPVVGEIADVANAGISLSRGDYAGAALSLLSAVPFVGYLGTAGKVGRYGTKAAAEASAKAANEMANRSAKEAAEKTAKEASEHAIKHADDVASKSKDGAKVTGGAAGKVDDLAQTKVKWVDENAGMSSRARDYNDSVTGARSNPATQSGQAPALERIMPDGSSRLVKFDGVDGDILVDRKISVVTTSKSKDQALRQSDVLSQNGLTARWEVPTQAQANRAQKMFDELGIKNISVKVIREPGNQ